MSNDYAITSTIEIRSERDGLLHNVVAGATGSGESTIHSITLKISDSDSDGNTNKHSIDLATLNKPPTAR
jgi:hypothetical protein